MDFQEELKGEIESIKRGTKIIFSVGMAILMLYLGLSLNWSSSNTLAFVLAIMGMVAGGISIIGFVKNWQYALKVFITGAAIVSLGAAILAFRTMS